MTLVEHWDDDFQSLLSLYNVTTEVELPSIWHTVAPFKKDRSRSAMEEACQKKTDIMILREPCVPHSIAVMILALDFHTQDTNRVGDSGKYIIIPGPVTVRGIGGGTPCTLVGRHPWGGGGGG